MLISPCDVNDGDVIQTTNGPANVYPVGYSSWRNGTIIDDPDRYADHITSIGSVGSREPFLVLKSYKRLNRGQYVVKALLCDGIIRFVGLRPGKQLGEHSFSIERLVTHA
jgi:hypothetical protein